MISDSVIIKIEISKFEGKSDIQLWTELPFKEEVQNLKEKNRHREFARECKYFR